MAANGISELSTKQLRQEAKLAKATAKRQGKVVAVDGTITGSIDTTKPYYRIANTLDITLLPTLYSGNTVVDNSNITGGTILSVSITTPYTRLDGGNYLTPANVSVSFTSAGQTNYDTGQPANAFTEATATPVITNGKLSGITIVSGGVGYQKYTGPGLQSGRVMADIFITDSTSGSPDSREIKIRTDLNITVNASNISNSGLVEGRPWTTVPSIRSFLSGSGQTAYDAASADSFFAVSQTDYDAVVAGVDSVSTVGPTNTQFTGSNGSPFSAGYMITYPVAKATVPASNYIIGFRATTTYANQQWRIYGGPTFKSTSPVYSQISTTSPSTGATTGTYYYLRKAPTVQAATTYIGIYGTQTLTMTSPTTGTDPGGAYTTGSFTSWTNWDTVMPKVQVIITPTAVI